MHFRSFSRKRNINTLVTVTVTVTAVEHGLRVRVISPVEKEKVYGGKDLLKSQVLSSEFMHESIVQGGSKK